jgi:hypothetical protein
MTSVPDPTACDCWLLTAALTNSAPLPDHVCPATMRATVDLWAASDAAARRRDGYALAARTVLMAGQTAETAALLGGVQVEGQSRDGIWPRPMHGRLLGLVVHEWAEEEPSELFANQLAEDPGWKFAFAFALELPPEERWSAFFQLLQSSGLPITPSVVQHAMDVAAGRRQHLPPQDLLNRLMEAMPAVADRVRPLVAELYPYGLDRSPTFEYFGVTEWVTGPILDRAREVQLKHRDWARRIALHPGNTLSAIRRLTPTAFRPHLDSDTRYDFLEEIRRTSNHLAEMVSTGRWNRNELISKHIRQVGNRVAQRRRDAGLPVNPPKGWTIGARRILESACAQRSS